MKQRPLLRGWSHALAVGPALLGTVILVDLAKGDPIKQISFLIYGFVLVSLFAMSAVYHVPTWSSEKRAALRRVDHANIFAMIAATYTPIVVTVLSGVARIAMLSTVWTLALSGVAIVLCQISVRKGLRTALYLALGWIAVLVAPLLVQRTGWIGVADLALGGALYSVGAIIYRLERPRLWSSVFGYHEIFHLLVIAATAAFYLFMIQVVVPLPVS